MTKTVSEDDARWMNDAETYGWTLPPKARLFWRLPGIRNIRGAWLTVQAEKQATVFAAAGIGLGQINPYDLWVLYAVFRGWC